MSAQNSEVSAAACSVIMEHTGQFEDVLNAYEVDLGQLPADKILVEMLVSSVNPSDKMRVLGMYPSAQGKEFNLVSSTGPKTVNGSIIGLEGVGKVIKVGSSVSQAINDTVSVGDWVIPLDFSSYGSWSSKVILSPMAVVVVKNKKGLTPHSLCSTKVNGLTAYRMLLDIVKLEKGDYVIQNGANSGVGQYLIQFAKLFGYKTINVIRNRPDYDETVTFLKDLGADLVVKDTDLDSKDTKKLFESLPGKIRLAINCVGGKAADSLAASLADGGTMATYGAMTLDPITTPSPSFIFKDIHLCGYWLNWFFEKNTVPQWMETWNHIFDLLRDGSIKAQASKYIDMFDVVDDQEVIVGADKFKSRLMQAINSKEKTGLRFSRL
ncbi:Trans-2-enoyl-CoA reductase, mitochondrial [Smittium mucronatum]|uniref:enoyl-[acyl-carrier-protein] reductase n=1 Tax=Smittium mucronatum TaxID=133383 RepID=A0A1R0GTY8_9FUNG|nr:Trans-2-enoyl-CoA reductase, mitochondrial [Smittium mucronatum]